MFNIADTVQEFHKDKGLLKASLYHEICHLYSELISNPSKVDIRHLYNLLENPRLRSICFGLSGPHREKIKSILKRQRIRDYGKKLLQKTEHTHNELAYLGWYDNEGRKATSHWLDFFDLKSIYESLLEKTKFYGELYPNTV